MNKFVKLHISTDDVVYVSIEKVMSMRPVKSGTLLKFIVPNFVEENGRISSQLYHITVLESIEEILEECR